MSEGHYAVHRLHKLVHSNDQCLSITDCSHVLYLTTLVRAPATGLPPTQAITVLLPPPPPPPPPHTHTQLSVLEKALQESSGKAEKTEAELASAHEHCNALETQLANTQDQLLDLERSKGVVDSVSTERLSQITLLQQQLEEGRVRDGLIGELRQQINTLEGRLSRLQTEVSLYLGVSKFSG